MIVIFEIDFLAGNYGSTGGGYYDFFSIIVSSSIGHVLLLNVKVEAIDAILF